MAQTTHMAQINVRLDSDLKRAGDIELERLGISPSKLVRALWAKLAASPHEARTITQTLIQEQKSSEQQKEFERKLKLYDEGPSFFFQFAKDMGLDPSTHVPLTDEQVEEARYQYLTEKYGA